MLDKSTSNCQAFGAQTDDFGNLREALTACVQPKRESKAALDTDMIDIIDGQTHAHTHGLLILAVAICMSGAALTVLLVRRMIQSTGLRTLCLWVLSSLIGGTTIWSTHFMSMLSYDPGVPHGYERGLTLLSLGIAALGMLATHATVLAQRWPARPYIAGALFGGTVSAMHYLGMAAYVVPGTFVWATDRVLLSIAAGAILGALAYHRILYPVTRYCWMGGTLAMICAICTMHFTGMSAFTILPEPLAAVPAETVSDRTFGVLVASVTGALFFVGYASYNIETSVEREANRRLSHAASHDSLTGLPNRLNLMRIMAETTGRLKADPSYKAAVVSIDIDFFGQVNGRHGHATGDAVLIHIAKRLTETVQRHEHIARTGGDEFIAIKHGFRRTEEVTAFASRLHAALIDPITLDDTEITLNASIGHANSVDDGPDLDALIVKSEQAMTGAQGAVDFKIHAYNAETNRQSIERSHLIEDLRHAARRNQFELVYQLQNDLETLEPVGFESLLRWIHPEKGRMSPDVFIPLAEETGLIRDIGLWVLRTACAQAVHWNRPYSVAVNVAPQQLIQPSFIETVEEILEDTGLPPDRLELEITEASMIDDHDHTLKVMHRLKDMGIRIAMDDFGTGYSSLSTLQAFPFDKIKIDRSFIQDVHVNLQRAAIVRSTLLLGAALDIPVLAEGVETWEELAFLQAENCASVQGYYFGEPLALDEVHDLIARTAQKHAS